MKLNSKGEGSSVHFPDGDLKMEVTTVFELVTSVSVQFGIKLRIAISWHVKVASRGVFPFRQVARTCILAF